MVENIEILKSGELGKIELMIKRLFKTPLLKGFCFLGRMLGPYTNKRVPKEKILKILLIQAGGIGDAVRIFPVLHALKEEIPDAAITILSPFDDELYRLFPHFNIVSETIILDLPGKHKSALSKLLLARFLRQKSFDLILCLHSGLGMIEFAVLSLLIGAPYRVGYDKDGAGFIHTSRLVLQESKSIYRQNLDLLKYAGIFPRFNEPYLALPQEDVAFAQSFLRRHGVTHNDLVFTISAVVAADTDHKSSLHERPLAEFRTWPQESYLGLIDQILHSYRAKVIVLGDRIAEGPLFDVLTNGKNHNLINAVGQTTVAQAGALINSSNLFIGNDSGPLHIAIALRMPCIGIFGSTSPKQQLMPDVDYCIPIWKGLECSPCYVQQPIPAFTCPYDINCLKSITVADVMEAIRSLPLSCDKRET